MRAATTKWGATVAGSSIQTLPTMCCFNFREIALQQNTLCPVFWATQERHATRSSTEDGLTLYPSSLEVGRRAEVCVPMSPGGFR